MLGYSVTTAIAMLPNVPDWLVHWVTPTGCAAGIGFVLAATRFERHRLGLPATPRLTFLEAALISCSILAFVPGLTFSMGIREWMTFGTSHRLCAPGPALPYVLGTMLLGFLNLIRVAAGRPNLLMVSASSFLTLTAVNDSMLALGFVDSMLSANFGALAFLLAVGFDESREWGRETHLLTEDKASLKASVWKSRSELEQTQERLEQSERLAALGRLAAAVGHEINNPLTYVMVNLEMLERAKKLDRELVAEALEGAQRIAEIVSQLRVLSKSDHTSCIDIDVCRALQTAIKTLKPRYEGKCRIIQDLQPNLFVRGNSGRLTQLLVNLLSNSIEAIADQEGVHSILARVSQGNGVVEVTIEDDGDGIPADLQATLFEPFATGRKGGLGLGLAIVRTIADEMRAQIEVRNKQPHGARFVVRFPQVQPTNANRQAASIGRSVLPQREFS